MTAFSRFDPRLQDKIVNNLGWNELRPVQDLAAHAVLDGNNCVILAPTAGGKTEASLFPVLSDIISSEKEGLRVLYICPTRALLNNQEERITTYAQMIGLDAFKWHGDVTPAHKKKFLKEPCEILLTTPESLEVMLDSVSIPRISLFLNLRYVIIDEIHALASCDRGNHLICVLERIRSYAKDDFQRIGLSATVGNPEHILQWMQGSSTRSQLIIDPPKIKSKKDISILLCDDDSDITQQISRKAAGKKSLVFCESRKLAESIASSLIHQGELVYVHHSSLSKEEREYSELQFTRGKSACIVCTSTMELGIDVGDLDFVLQINTPRTVSSFLQRMGRTGRRNNTVSNTTFFITEDSVFITAIAIVELAKEGYVESVKTSNSCWHLLLHQLMAMCLENGAITREDTYQKLHQAHPFSGISKVKMDAFLDYLLETDILHNDGNSYSMGLKAEKDFGKKNFMELYSVFSTPVEFEVIGVSGDTIGTIEWSFLDSLMEHDSSFYLAGQAWSVERIEYRKKTVFVVRAPSGKIPKWGGISPNFLGYELCRKMKDILTSDDDFSYLDRESQRILNSIRADKKEFLSQSFAPVFHDDKGIMWYTYAGGFVNSTLRFAFEVELHAEVQTTNEYIKIKSNNLTWNQFTQTLKTISNEHYWDNPDTIRKIISLMPNYRLSKFQDYLPDELQLRIVADTILDIKKTKHFLKELQREEEECRQRK